MSLSDSFIWLKNDIPENKKGLLQDEKFHFVNYWCSVWEFPPPPDSLVIVQSSVFLSFPWPLD